ncbi:hypothetical protein CN675_08690 [Bacillus toyonensis]|uniref:hypothetical protein n=1 Tax=Bacillus toyonensis TaxID=155322 RepID=UPI000BF1851B|nr:hypothetical protein [Bacillus toyonensis]PEJ20470.1 hypothetical protein CN675_08690 [Bacillus toyonensis]
MNYDVEIKGKEEQKQKLLDEMEIKKEQFLQELIAFTSNWFENDTIHTIKSNPEKVIQLGEDKARELKGKLKELQEKSSELVREYIGIDRLWWHKNKDALSYYESPSLQKKYDDQIRLMLGEFGKIFIEYGIEDAAIEHDVNRSCGWVYADHEHKKVKYRFGLNFPKELIDISNQYNALVLKTKSIDLDISELNEKKNEDNIEEFWKSL